MVVVCEQHTSQQQQEQLRHATLIPAPHITSVQQQQQQQELRDINERKWRVTHSTATLLVYEVS